MKTFGALSLCFCLVRLSTTFSIQFQDFEVFIVNKTNIEETYFEPEFWDNSKNINVTILSKIKDTFKHDPQNQTGHSFLVVTLFSLVQNNPEMLLRMICIKTKQNNKMIVNLKKKNVFLFVNNETNSRQFDLLENLNISCEENYFINRIYQGYQETNDNRVSNNELIVNMHGKRDSLNYWRHRRDTVNDKNLAQKEKMNHSFVSSFEKEQFNNTHNITNNPPFVNYQMQKIQVTLGQLSRISIPDDIFTDIEDNQNNISLVISLQTERGILLNSKNFPWIYFDANVKEIILLPADANVSGVWNFNLTATDSEGLNASTELIVSIRESKVRRKFNHAYEIKFSVIRNETTSVNEWENKHPIWPVNIFNKISSLLKIEQTSNIYVLNYNLSQGLFRWTIYFLGIEECPTNFIKIVLKKLTKNSDKITKFEPSKNLVQIFYNYLKIQSVALSRFGICQKTITNITAFDPPVIRNPIGRLDALAGEMFRFKIPQDFCFDVASGLSTESLSLDLFTEDHVSLSRTIQDTGWILYEKENQFIFGLPMAEDVGRNIYILRCSNSAERFVEHGIEIIVVGRPFSERHTLEIEFVFKSKKRQRHPLKMANLLKTLFDKNSRTSSFSNDIIIENYNKNSVIWTNKSFINIDCHDKLVTWFKNQLINSHDLTLKNAVKQHFLPYYVITSVHFIENDDCHFKKVENVDKALWNKAEYFLAFFGPKSLIMTALIPIAAVTAVVVLILSAVYISCYKQNHNSSEKDDVLPARTPIFLMDDPQDEENLGLLQSRPTPAYRRKDIMV